MKLFQFPDLHLLHLPHCLRQNTKATNPEGRYGAYAMWLIGKPEWAEITIPFGNFKSFEQKVWKDGTQKIFRVAKLFRRKNTLS